MDKNKLLKIGASVAIIGVTATILVYGGKYLYKKFIKKPDEPKENKLTNVGRIKLTPIEAGTLTKKENR